MKKVVLISALLSVLTLYSFSSGKTLPINGFTSEAEKMQALVTFYKPLPAEILLLDRINFSFLVDQSVIARYRYMIQGPKGLEISIDEGLKTWSPWKYETNAEIKLQTFDKAGVYKLIVEYSQHSSAEIRSYEKSFEVKWEYPPVRDQQFRVDNNYIGSGSKAEQLRKGSEEYRKQYDIWLKSFINSLKGSGLSIREPESLIRSLSESITKTSGSVLPATIGKTVKAGTILKSSEIFNLIQKGNPDLIRVFRNPEANLNAAMASVSKALADIYGKEYELLASAGPVTEKNEMEAGKSDPMKKENELADIKNIESGKLVIAEKIVVAVPETAAVTENNKASDSSIKEAVEEPDTTDYDVLLHDAITARESELVMRCLNNNADINIKSETGGTIFHMLSGPLEDGNIISSLKSRGLSINKPDNFGNSPLHYALLRSKMVYAGLLISQGADPETKNQSELTPLHLAVLLGQTEIVKKLLATGTSPDIRGNSGYTALHIAAELGYGDITKELLLNGADRSIKNGQKLKAKSIAGIQDNDEIIDLLRSSGKKPVSPVNNPVSSSLVKTTPYPTIDFNLPYDPILLKKRNASRIIQVASVPVFVASAAGALYFRNEANKYYTLYKNAENIDDATYYYDLTNKNDTYALVSVSISAVSVYTFIHSTLSRNRITARMSKNL